MHELNTPRHEQPGALFSAAANRYVQLMDALRRGERGKDVDQEGGAHGMGRAAWLLHDATTAQLLQDAFASDAVQFAVLQVSSRLVRASC